MLDRSQRIRGGATGQRRRQEGTRGQLAQFASRISTVMKFGAGAGDDPLATALMKLRRRGSRCSS